MQINRRRFLVISAAAGTMAFGGTASAAPYRWQGTALGAKASLLLHHPDKQQAERIVSACVAEISRLENIFSLYRQKSAVVQLNSQGFLDHPPLELVQALADCRRISDITAGAFDVTVQPLWQLYAGHFSSTDPDSKGPSADKVALATSRIDYRKIAISSDRIEFGTAGMSLTLNGFAQGYITDRIADLLRSEGLKNVLVDLGETRALDDHPAGRPWRVGIRDPKSSSGVVRTLAVDNLAVATSGGYGQKFHASSPQHHLFDPKTGAANDLYASVTVLATRAATADALSTALSGLPIAEAADILRESGAKSALFLNEDGSFEDVQV